jgi:hypothetical protein
LIADVSGFEELMRVRIAATVSQAVREVDRSILESWLNLSGSEFDNFVGSVCGWNIDGAKIKVPINKDNEAKGTVVRENVKFDRKSTRTTVAEQLLTACQNLQGSSRGHTNSLHERHDLQYDDMRLRFARSAFGADIITASVCDRSVPASSRQPHRLTSMARYIPQKYAAMSRARVCKISTG